VVLGSQKGAGSTSVTAFESGPYSGQWIIGGISNDPDFNNDLKGECINNCAYIAVWTPKNFHFIGSWRFKNQNKVEEIVSDSKGKRAAILFSNSINGVSNYSLTVFNWTNEETI